MTFSGFPIEGQKFLQDLRENNNKDWFEPRKSQYVALLQTPALAFVEAIGERLREIAPNVVVDTRTNGGGNLMRLHRDTRFSADKSPYKTNIAMMFYEEGGKKMGRPGFGLQITPDEGGLMTGIFGFEKPMLEAYRAAVLDNKKGGALVNAVAQVKTAGAYVIEGATLKNVPRGYDKDHPRAEWLRFTGLHGFGPAFGWDVIATPH